MAQGYYTLPEAAEFLGISVDELRQMAQKGKIRSFQDRGTMRFRHQDIQELASKRGQSRDPDLTLGDGSLPASKAPPPASAASKAGPKSASQQKMPDVFDFQLDAEEKIDLGADFLIATGKSESTSGANKSEKPAPAPGRDSDVRLAADPGVVPESEERDVGVILADTTAKLGPVSSSSAPASGGRPSSKISLGSGVEMKAGPASQPPSAKPGNARQPMDSGVRFVPQTSDSDVKLVAGSDDGPIGTRTPTSRTDSDVRLDQLSLPVSDSGEAGMMRTEEVNLDEEILKQEKRAKDQPPPHLKAKSKVQFPTNSPFELSESELRMPSELLGDGGPPTPRLAAEQPADSSDFELPAHMPDEVNSDLELLAQLSDDSSSNFDLAAQQPDDGGSDFELASAADELKPLADSDDFSLEAPDHHEQPVTDEPTELGVSVDGGELSDADVSLEDGAGQPSEDVDFDLSLEVEDTPKPQRDAPAEDSGDFQLKVADTPTPADDSSPALETSSEFELSLDSDESQPAAGEEEAGDIDLSLDVEDHPEPTDDSEFEINLDNSNEGEMAQVDAGSEFELTLDDVDAAELEDSDAAPQVKSKTKAHVAEGDEPDIFESDFEVPALDEGEGEAAADSELESSDFDLALDDSEIANEEESGSQVVALDEEEDAETQVDDDAAAVDDSEVEEEESDFDQLDADVEVDDDAEAEVETDDEGAEVETRTVTRTKLIEPAPWGVMPVIFMLPCAVIMLLVAFLGYEMVQSSVGNRPPGVLTVQFAGLFGHDLTKKR